MEQYTYDPPQQSNMQPPQQKQQKYAPPVQPQYQAPAPTMQQKPSKHQQQYTQQYEQPQQQQQYEQPQLEQQYEQPQQQQQYQQPEEPIEVPPICCIELKVAVLMAAIVDGVLSFFLALYYVINHLEEGRIFSLTTMGFSLGFFVVSLVLLLLALMKKPILGWIWIVVDAVLFVVAMALYGSMFWGKKRKSIKSDGKHIPDPYEGVNNEWAAIFLLFFVALYKIYESVFVYYYMYGKEKPPTQQQRVAPVQMVANNPVIYGAGYGSGYGGAQVVYI